jgi:hypothetical protein
VIELCRRNDLFGPIGGRFMCAGPLRLGRRVAEPAHRSPPGPVLAYSPVDAGWLVDHQPFLRESSWPVVAVCADRDDDHLLVTCPGQGSRPEANERVARAVGLALAACRTASTGS